MKIFVADHAGFCFGVRRAVELARAAAAKSDEVFSVGELIHNPKVLRDLESEGIYAREDFSRVRDGSTVILRAHGVSDSRRKELEKNFEVVDASCPFVQNLHAAAGDSKIPVVIFGDRDHPEMISVVEDFPETIVTRDMDFDFPPQFLLLSQTTENQTDFENFAEKLHANNLDFEIKNTICRATAERKKSALALAEDVDLMLIVGGRKSNNTRTLAALVSQKVPTRHVESADEIEAEWFTKIQKVGIAAGASTPESEIACVVARLEKISKEG